MRHRPGQVLYQLVCLVALAWACPLVIAQLSHGRLQFSQPIYTASEDFGVALVTVQRHLGSDGRAAIYVSTVTTGGGNAVLGRDFRPLFNQSLIWQDGDDLDRQLYVRVLNDAKPQEANKTFTLYLHDANGAELNPERNQTQIVLVPPTNLLSGSFRFLTAAVTAVESASAVLEIPVLWEGGTTSSARVAYITQCESACSPDDFEVVSTPILTWTRGGNTTQLIRIRVKDDGIFEPPETFLVNLLPPQDLDPLAPDPVNDPSSMFTLPPATLGNITSVRVTIQGPNNVNSGIAQFEAACFPACPSVQYSVMDGGLVRAYVQRRNGSDGYLQARMVSVDGTARSGVDYQPVDQIVRWSDGDASTQFVLVQTIAGVVRTSSMQFSLTLVDIHGSSSGTTYSAPSSGVAATTTVTINGPSNIAKSDVNFVQLSPLGPVLHFPDESFLPMVTRFDSGVRVCPRITVRQTGELTLYLRRSFGTMDHGAASIVVSTQDDSAVDGVDYVGTPTEGQTIAWSESDTRSTIKTLTIGIPAPPTYYTERRSFFVEITRVTGVALGLCSKVEVVLEGLGRPPRIVAFALNMNQGTLTLHTSHAVLANTFAPSSIQLQSDAGPTTTSVGSGAFETFELGAPSTTATNDGQTIVVTLSVSDLNALKRFTRLAKSQETTFLSAAPGAFDYVLESCLARGFTACKHAKLESIPGTNAMAVSTFTPDTTAPVLVDFTVDLGLALVKLRFSEPVDGSRVRLESLGFSDTANAADVWFLSSSSSQLFRPNPSPLSGVLLYDGNPLPPDATYLTVQIGPADLASLRALGGGQFGLQGDSTFLTMDSDFVADWAVPPNAVVAIAVPTLAAPALRLLRVAAPDCSPCPAGSFLASSCSATRSRVCRPCTVCPTNSFALAACSPFQDTTCYPCTECIGGRYTQSECSPTSDRVCATCTFCSSDEYEASPCAAQADRVCRTCDSCTLTIEQQRLCSGSKRWRRRQMKRPYGCPAPGQTFQTLEARLQRSKSNRCGAGRCSCTGNLPGNANPNGESFPDDPRCTGPEVFGIDL